MVLMSVCMQTHMSPYQSRSPSHMLPSRGSNPAVMSVCVQTPTSPHQSQSPTHAMPSRGSNPSEQVATSTWQQLPTGPLPPRLATNWELIWPPSMMHFHRLSCSCLWLAVLVFRLLQAELLLCGLAWVTCRYVECQSLMAASFLGGCGGCRKQSVLVVHENSGFEWSLKIWESFLKLRYLFPGLVCFGRNGIMVKILENVVTASVRCHLWK